MDSTSVAHTTTSVGVPGQENGMHGNLFEYNYCNDLAVDWSLNNERTIEMYN